ncbi:MAG: hypothetical protein KatS3mg060_3503 [Dehalococcoidia bacterium]|nr:MAG: hypothetical protein KatS3mg060_3503 [Dehalococcoidia bacterium]
MAASGVFKLARRLVGASLRAAATAGRRAGVFGSSLNSRYTDRNKAG